MNILEALKILKEGACKEIRRPEGKFTQTGIIKSRSGELVWADGSNKGFYIDCILADDWLCIKDDLPISIPSNIEKTKIKEVLDRLNDIYAKL